ncbi:pyridoxamine 5'-phosphate oxidase family protein [Amycolatopsis sp. 195334CR]|uniref:pyridoxamine 5'-phosphate oxidase family protein n=1 Tax=Amycolatopsis sp. 195334CR TaxID=2814588 RepID=UPI001A8D246F|nr:pyridoxamine 5'-phosphate oxidase family protein [Amycolatopsis sp. 195334CR]MBN6039045.1 pyridoxamine 5'-phosphate oxidase family protein [Amycolatopsis sp. 195334CR]
MTSRVKEFGDLEAEFNAYVGAIVYATMVTVDAKNRPRTRVLIPVWENVDGEPLGWLATYHTPVKAAHLAGNPHTNFSYWARGNNSVAIDATAEWDNALPTKERVWELYRRTSPRGAGYPLGNFWKAPSDPELHVLRLKPWRVQVIRGADLRSRIWRADGG